MQPILKKTTAAIARSAVLLALSVSLSSVAPAQAQSAFPLTRRTILASVLALTNVPGKPAPQDDGEEARLTPVKRSRLAPIKLSEGALRFEGKKQTNSLMEALEKFAKQNKVTLGATEVLVWQTEDAFQKDFADLCVEAGYRYKAQPTIETDEGKITLFACAPEPKDSKKSGLFGFWGTNGRTLVLTWAVVKSEEKSTGRDSKTPEILPNSKPTATGSTSTGKPAAKETLHPTSGAQSGSKAQDGKTQEDKIQEGKVPSEMLGEWNWTTISSVNYRDTTTNQLTEPSGMSARFTFSRDGRYKMMFYIRQRTYSLVSESTTTEEGTVTFGEGTFTMHPEKGYYKGHTGSRVIDRPMTGEERKVRTYCWEWRKEDGTRRLFLGPNTRSLSPFKSVK